MYTVKVLVRATIATLSLGIGAAIAQETGSMPDYWSEKNAAAMPRQAAPAKTTNSVGDLHSFWMHSRPADYSYVAVGG